MLEKTKKRPSLILQIVMAILILTAGVAANFTLTKLKKLPEEKSSIDQRELVNTAPVLPFQEEVKISASGLVSPFREINLAAEVSGRITFKSDVCKPGSFVNEGVELLKIDSKEYQLAVDRFQAEVEQAKAQLEEIDSEISGAQKLLGLSRQDVDVQKREVERLQKLGNAVTAAELDRSTRALITAQNAMISQENLVNVLESRKKRLISSQLLADTNLAKAKLDLDRAIIKAPITGLIVEESVEQDNFVQRGAPLLKMEDISKAEVSISLRSDQLDRILEVRNGSAGMTANEADANRSPPFDLPQLPAKIVYEVGGRKLFCNGHLWRLDGVGLDERTRTIPCRLLVENPTLVSGNDARPLMRGMFVSVELSLPARTNLLQIPDAAVQSGNLVWAVSDNKLQRYHVDLVQRTTDENGNEVVVFQENEQSPAVGTSVVISPLSSPRQGMEVRIKPALDEISPTTETQNAPSMRE